MNEKNCKLKKRKNVKQYWTLENGEIYYFSTYEPYPLPLIVNILNKMEDDTLMLEEENEQLRKELKEKQEDEKEYAREILRLNKLVKEYSEIRQLGGDY